MAYFFYFFVSVLSFSGKFGFLVALILSQARGGRPVAVGGATFKFKNKGTQRMGLDAQRAEANVMGLEDKISGSQLGPIPAERDRPMRVSLMIELSY
jgi:hypothetical protein